MKIQIILAAMAPIFVAACATETEIVVMQMTAAEANCLGAVAGQAGVSGVTTISVTPSEAGTSVMVAVPEAEAPWNCVADDEGNVQDVYYTAEG